MDWLLHTVTGGGLLLLASWWLMRRLRDPVRRQRLGEWGVLAAVLVSALSLGPAWLQVPLPSSPAEPLPVAPLQTSPVPPPAPQEDPFVFVPDEEQQAEAPALLTPAPPATGGSGDWLRQHIAGVVLAAYGLGAAVVLGRWLLGHLALWRLLRRSRPAPAEVARLFAAMAPPRRARLLVSEQARVPFSCGLVRPAVVLPVALVQAGAAAPLRWVFAHELTHLERRDAWSGLLLSLAQAVYFYLPWFWWLRRQVRLCQEYLADAAAAHTGHAVDYAQFLVGWAGAPAPPVGCTGVSGSCSDLFRRVSMLLHNRAPLQRRCPRRFSLLTAGGLLGLAVLLAGLGAQAGPAPRREEPPKSEPKKEKAPKQEPQQPNPLGVQIDKLLERLPDDFDAQKFEQLRKELEKHRGQFEKAFRGLRGGFPNELMGPLGWQGLGPEPRLGARVAQPSATLADQFDLPQGQGLVIEHVRPNSPADKAGLKAHDVLLELNGKPVSSNVAALLAQLAQIKADRPIDAVVLRKGKKETIKGIRLAAVKAAHPEADLGFFPPAEALLKAGNLNLGNFGAGLGGNGVMTTTFRSGDRFTSRHQEGSLVITVTGKVADGKATLSEIRVQDGGESHRYEDPDKVPERYRDKVKNLVEMSEKGAVKVEIKKP
jgi:beta-lactamase regulating signal transducer with metallopeptidase domain